MDVDSEYQPATLWRKSMVQTNSKLSCDNSADFILETLESGRICKLDLLGHDAKMLTIANVKTVLPIYR